MPFRRAKRGRRPPPLGSKKAQEGEPDEPRPGDSEKPKQSSRERIEARAESEKRAAKAERKARRRARWSRAKPKASDKPAAEPKPSEKARAKPTASEKAQKKPRPAGKPAAEAGLTRRRPRSERPARSRGAKPSARRSRSRSLGERAKSTRSAIAKSAAPHARKAGKRLETATASAEKAVAGALSSFASGAKVVALLVWGGLQEIGSVWIRTAEVAGAALLWLERSARPYVLAALRGLRAALRFAERVVTPERAVAFVVIAAAIILAASQFVDYRGVEIGAPAYADVESVAPAPQTEVETTGSVHGYAMVPVAVVMIGAALLALRGRWRIARVIAPLGLLVIAVSLLLDARKGLQEGEVGIAYQGAHAVLNEGFWLQICSAAVLVLTGLLLTRYAHARAAPPQRSRREPGKRAGRRRRLRIAGVRA